MKQDPHEHGQRTSKYTKNNHDEDFLFELNQALLKTGGLMDKGEARLKELPLIYIVGAPRSGTTLLSQILSRCLPVGYINNLIAKFWTRPSVGIRLSKMLLGDEIRERISFTSSYGTTTEIWGPHEYGYFWRQWLQLDRSPTHHLTPEFIAGLDRTGLKSALEKEILATFNLPVVFKNVICGFQASFLTEIHPKSLFIHIKRDPYVTAASILNARFTRFGSYQTWWSLKPSSWPFDTVAGDAGAEVVRQVMECRREMDEELSNPGVKAFQVEYEDLCARPDAVLESVCQEIKRLGFEIGPIYTGLPAFKISNGPEIPEKYSLRLKELLNIPAE